MENKIAERIKELRKKFDLTQSELAKKIGIDPTAISGYERAVRMPSRINSEKMADLFNVSVDYLLDRTDDPNPPRKDISNVETVSAKKIPLLDRIPSDWDPSSFGMVENHFTVSVDLEADFALEIEDDSMAPAINPGTVVLVSSKKTLEDGEIGIISLEEKDAICRQYNRYDDVVILKAKNGEKHKDIVLSAEKFERECRVFGAVIAKFELF